MSTKRQVGHSTMAKAKIHSTAVVERGAHIGADVTIEPYAVVKAHTIVEDGVTIKAHAYIDGHTTIGQGTLIYPSASIGTAPQNLKYRGTTRDLIIGKNCIIREFVTINCSHEGHGVRVGDNCFIMAYCHIAHNCVLGKHVVMSNQATLAGHVIVEDHVNIGGIAAVHQFVHIGAYAMVGGLSRVTNDVPPYSIGAGIPYKMRGLNIVGLKRHGFTLATRAQLSKAFRLMYRSGLKPNEALTRMREELDLIPEVQHWIEFCENSRRGLSDLQGVGRGLKRSDDILEECAEEEAQVGG